MTARRPWTLTLVAMLGARWLLQRLGAGRAGALTAALVYGLTPYQLAFTARMSVLLLPWALLPWIALVAAVKFHEPAAAAVAVIALIAAHLPRALAARQFQQSWQGVLFHTPAIALFIALQWFALLNRLSGRSVAWRGRSEIPAK